MARPRSVGRFIGMIHRFSRQHFGTVMAPHGLPEQALPFLMRLLDRDDVSQDELAEHFWVDKATAARTLAKLEEEGYVTRTPDQRDKRVKRVRITARAREVAPELRRARGAWAEKLMEGFTSDERERVTGLLERMAENARRHAQAPDGTDDMA